MKKQEKNRRSDCPIANSLEILGDRWTLLIIRDLMFRGMREFGELMAAGEGIATNILAERLERLRASGLINKYPHPKDRKKYQYRLTAAGIELAPVLIDLTLWGIRNAPGTYVPPDILRAMKNDREGLIRMIRQKLHKKLH